MEEGRWGTLLAALLCREGTVWEIVDEMGGIRPVGSDTAGLEEMLRTDPALVLRGKGPRGEVWEVRLAGEAPVISRATLPSLYDGGELRPESFDPRIDRRVLRAVLREREKGNLGPTRRRGLAAADFLGRVLDLVAGITAPLIVECGTGPSPLGFILHASLMRAGYSPRFVGIEASPAAVTAARELATRLGLEGVELVTGELGASDSPSLSSFSPHLLLAVHLCGSAVYDAIDLGRRSKVGAMVLVPCCAPAGSWEGAGFSYGKAASHDLLRVRLDRVGMILSVLQRMTEAGYHVELFETYLPPWREVEIGLLAYRPGGRGKIKAWR